MKKFLAIGAVAIFYSLALSGAAQADIDEEKNGIYFESVKIKFGGRGIHYKADTITQLCFASAGHVEFEVIPCENLVKRAGWDAILTWIKPDMEDVK